MQHGFFTCFQLSTSESGQSSFCDADASQVMYTCRCQDLPQT
jgi:hypothetical protein